jgi:hypothetical protein
VSPHEIRVAGPILRSRFSCYNKFMPYPINRQCRHCESPFVVEDRFGANRQHCSKQCAKNHASKTVKDWRAKHGWRPEYNERRLAKNPGAWREKSRADRATIIALLGGACVVCGATNPSWLHADYIPTTRNERFRHPRHLKWVRANQDKFRLLCANHHYELTLTGKIEGTTITQPCNASSSATDDALGS